MRVLINTKPSVLRSKTGIGYYVSNVYEELLKSGIDIIPTVDFKSQKFLNWLSFISLKCRALLVGQYPSFMINIGDIIVKALGRTRNGDSSFDIYHETEFEPIPRVDTKKIVFNIYDLSVIKYPHFFNDGISKNRGANLIANALKSDRIIVNTEFIKNEIVDTLKVEADKIDVIPLAPSAGYYKIESKNKIPKTVRSFTKKDYLLCVGTIEPRKNLKTLIRAFAEIKKKYNISLVIAGDFGWLYDDIVSYPNEIGVKNDVKFTGYVDEKTMLHLYNNALCFIYPSIYEGFGMPPLEAMSCGIPVILSDIAPLREVAGDAALFFNPYNYEEIAAVIDRVISSDDLRRSLSEAGLRRAQQYSWKRSVRLVLKTYEKVLSL